TRLAILLSLPRRSASRLRLVVLRSVATAQRALSLLPLLSLLTLLVSSTSLLTLLTLSSLLTLLSPLLALSSLLALLISLLALLSLLISLLLLLASLLIRLAPWLRVLGLRRRPVWIILVAVAVALLGGRTRGGAFRVVRLVARRS